MLSASRWLFWATALALPVLAFTGLQELHNLRPQHAVVVVNQANFSATVAITDPNTATSAATRVGLPDDWQKRQTQGSVGWYQADINLAEAPDELWGVYIPSLEMAPTVYINGVMVGGLVPGELSHGQALPRYWNRPVLYPVASTQLQAGQNSLDVRIEVVPTWGRLSEVYLAPYRLLQPSYQWRYFWRVTFLNLTAVGALMLALFMAALSLARQDPVFRWFAGFAFSWYLHNLFFLTLAPPLANQAWDLCIFVVLAAMVYTASVLAFRFVGQPHPAWERLMQLVFAFGFVTLLGLAFTNHQALSIAVGIAWNGVLMVLGLLPCWMMLRHMNERRDLEGFCLSFCFVFTLLCAGHDWLVQTGLGYRHNGHLMQFASAPTLTTFGLILLRRFVAALRESDSLNRHLETRVAQKAAEIRQAFQRNRELESQQLLAAERMRIMRDMHDGVGGQLIGVMSMLDRTNPHDADIARELTQALGDLRLMIDSLDDVENDVVIALGLFRNRVQPMLDAAGVELLWQIEDLPAVPDLGPQRVLHLLRMLQEALTNCIKHAAASRIIIATEPVRLVNNKPCIAISVMDNGCGFGGTKSPGRGLKNLQHRAQAADLELETESGAAGTRVTIGFALSR